MVLYKMKKQYAPWMILAALVVGGFAFISAAQEQRTSTLSLAADHDQDGLSNKEEALYGTNPDVRDTDGDGYSDGVEVESGYDPLIPSSEGDRLIGIGSGRAVSGEEIAQSRHLTNELRTRVAGIAFDVMNGKEVSLDDVDKEIEGLLDGTTGFEDVSEVDVADIRIKKQDYGDMDAKDREAQVQRDVTEYVTALSYVMSLYAPQPVNTLSDMDAFAQQLVSQTSSLEDDYTNTTYFEQFIPRGEKLLTELNDIEVPEVMLPLHVEGLQLAYAAISVGKSFKNIPLDDPASAAVAFSRVQALMTLAVEFTEKVDAQMEEYNITL